MYGKKGNRFTRPTIVPNKKGYAPTRQEVNAAMRIAESRGREHQWVYVLVLDDGNWLVNWNDGDSCMVVAEWTTPGEHGVQYEFLTVREYLQNDSEMRI